MVETTDFSSPTNIAWAGHVGSVEYGGGDRAMVVIFFKKASHNPAKSLAHGSPQYDEQTFVRIHPPGERLNIIERPAHGADARRWPTQWNQYNQNKEQVPEGIPIGLLYPDKPAVEATLRACGVFTIEQCADLSGPAIDNIGMGAQQWVNDAKKYLEYANKGVKAAQFRAEMEEKDREIKGLKHQVEALTISVEQLRNHGAKAADLQTIQAMIAGAMAGRPQHIGQGFDPQLAQINATSPANLPKRRGRPKL